MAISRRQFVRRCAGSAIAATHALPAWAAAMPAHAPVTVPNRLAFADPTLVQQLATRAIDAARQAGATYADVRITRTVQEVFRTSLISDNEELAIGVRALVRGAWGFAASPFWTVDASVQLARAAVTQARENARESTRVIDIGLPAPVTGTWVMPVRYDPFSISLEEKVDFARSWEAYARQYRPARVTQGGIRMSFYRQERTVATTEGAFVTQTVYQTEGSYGFGMNNPDWHITIPGQVSARELTASGRGWELFLDARLNDQVPQLIETLEEQFRTPSKAVEVGRYDLVFDAATAARLVDQTIGVPTELDRAMGYEANASGTSYLGPDPLKNLGTFRVGGPLVTVVGERRTEGTLAAVQWDDEGIVPDDFMIVQNGILTDYQTTREQASWIAPWYRSQNKHVRSHGCAGAQSALHAVGQRPPNLVLRPGEQAMDFHDFVAGTARGIAIMGSGVTVDFQARNGGGGGIMREIKDGKLGPFIYGGGFLFNSTEFWNHVTAIGGAASARWTGMSRFKGEPGQSTAHSVSAVPMAVSGVAIYDAMKRA